MSVDTVGANKTIYTCALGPLSEPHPIAGDSPAILLTSETGQLGFVPLEGVSDVSRVLGVRVAGPSSGIFHCVSRGPSAKLVIHQNGVPIRTEIGGSKLQAFDAEELSDAASTIRVTTVTSENNERSLVLRTTSSTAWPETLAMMGAPLAELESKSEEQATLFRDFQTAQQGSSLKVFRLDELKPKVRRSTVLHWWSYVIGRVQADSGKTIGPFLSRAVALSLLEQYKTDSGEYLVEPLLLPLADLFGVEVRATGGLETDDEFVRLCSDVRMFLSENNLIVRQDDADPMAAEGRNGVAVILHPAAPDWTAHQETEEDMLATATAASA
jgi:hypothetical protein